MILKAIVVVDQNWAIGCKGQLLLHVPEDLKHFKERTWGSIVVYGKNTLASFPKSRPLPGRPNWILSSSLSTQDSSFLKDENIRLFATLEDLFSAFADLPEDEVVWIIGGAQLYRQLLPYCDQVVVTKLDYAAPCADVFFSNLDENPAWQLGEKGSWQLSEKAGIAFSICVYSNVNVERYSDEK